MAVHPVRMITVRLPRRLPKVYDLAMTWGNGAKGNCKIPLYPLPLIPPSRGGKVWEHEILPFGSLRAGSFIAFRFRMTRFTYPAIFGGICPALRCFASLQHDS